MIGEMRDDGGSLLGRIEDQDEDGDVGRVVHVWLRSVEIRVSAQQFVREGQDCKREPKDLRVFSRMHATL